jgi:hypothetical protein
MKHCRSSLGSVSSTDQGGGKRRAGNLARLLPVDHPEVCKMLPWTLPQPNFRISFGGQMWQ